MDNLGGPSDNDVPSSLNSFGDELGFSPELVETPESDQSKIDRLEEELRLAKEEAYRNWSGLKLLMSICKERGFDPFEGESLPIVTPLKDMTREALAERNREATQRIESTRHADSKDKIPQPTPEQMEALYKPAELTENQQAIFDKLINPGPRQEARTLKFDTEQ